LSERKRKIRKVMVVVVVVDSSYSDDANEASERGDDVIKSSTSNKYTIKHEVPQSQLH
jgi:hypothetical protein